MTERPPSRIFDQAQIRALLTELGADLDARGVRAELFIVGGAAMTLAYNTRRATRDVDAVFEPKAEIAAAAKRIAETHGLPEDWLNEGVKGFLPGPDPAQRAILSAPGIDVSVPSPRYLLALKVAAARVDRDVDDIRTLAGLCGATTADELLTITEEVMGGRQPLLPKTQFLIEELFPPKVSRWADLRARLGQAVQQRRDERAQRPPKPVRAVKPPRVAGRCGMPTRSGRPCRNRRGSCPVHR